GRRGHRRRPDHRRADRAGRVRPRGLRPARRLRARGPRRLVPAVRTQRRERVRGADEGERVTAPGKSCARREGGASPAWAAWPPTEGGSTPGSPSAQDSAAQGSTGEGSAAEAQRLLSAAATGAFRLNGAFLAVSEGIART